MVKVTATLENIKNIEKFEVKRYHFSAEEGFVLLFENGASFDRSVMDIAKNFFSTQLEQAAIPKQARKAGAGKA